MRTQMEKAEAFRALHARAAPSSFPIPGTPAQQNCSRRWGSRRSRPRASALPIRSAAPPSASMPSSRTAATIADATDLPVNADLENCGADDPKTAAKAIARAAEAGCVGGSIEDFTGNPQQPDLRLLARGRARAGGGRSGARAAVPVHADGAGGEFPARAATISTTRSSGCRRSRPSAPTCCIRPACTTSTRSAPWCHRSDKPFNLVMGFADPTLTVPISSRQPASSASASAARWRATRLRRSSNAPAR